MDDEIRRLVKERIVSNMEVISDAMSPEKRKEYIDESLKLIDKLQTQQKIDDEIIDKAWKRDLSERNQIPMWINVSLEIAKIVSPIGTFIGGIKAYDVFQKRMFKFEENGTITSYTSKQMKLPRFMK